MLRTIFFFFYPENDIYEFSLWASWFLGFSLKPQNWRSRWSEIMGQTMTWFITSADSSWSQLKKQHTSSLENTGSTYFLVHRSFCGINPVVALTRPCVHLSCHFRWDVSFHLEVFFLILMPLSWTRVLLSGWPNIMYAALEITTFTFLLCCTLVVKRM